MSVFSLYIFHHHDDENIFNINIINYIFILNKYYNIKVLPYCSIFTKNVLFPGKTLDLLAKWYKVTHVLCSSDIESYPESSTVSPRISRRRVHDVSFKY